MSWPIASGVEAFELSFALVGWFIMNYSHRRTRLSMRSMLRAPSVVRDFSLQPSIRHTKLSMSKRKWAAKSPAAAVVWISCRAWAAFPCFEVIGLIEKNRIDIVACGLFGIDAIQRGCDGEDWVNVRSQRIRSSLTQDRALAPRLNQKGPVPGRQRILASRSLGQQNCVCFPSAGNR